MFTCENNKKTVVGYLDETTRIVAAERFFIIQQKSKKTEKWCGKHYYSQFSDMLRAYVRMLMHNEQSAEQSRSVLQLLDYVLALDKKVEDIGKKLQLEWQNMLNKVTKEKIDNKETSSNDHTC